MKVYVTRKIPEAGINLLKKKGYKVEVYPKDHPITEKDLIKYASDSDALLCLLTDNISESVVNKFPNLKVISNYAVGYNNIDIEAATKRNIAVTNTPGVLTDATADLTMSLILAASRNIIQSDKFLKSAKFKGWDPMLHLGVDLYGKTIGIVGAGRIGTAVAKRAFAFNMKIIYVDHSQNEFINENLNGKKTTLASLMKNSDVVSLHIPLTPKTKDLISREYLDMLKSTAVLINTARGEIIDEDYLIEMLKDRRIFAAGFDVYQNEPNIHKELSKLDNVVAVSHIGSATFGTRSKMSEIAAKNIISVLSGKKPDFIINKEIYQTK